MHVAVDLHKQNPASVESQEGCGLFSLIDPYARRQISRQGYIRLTWIPALVTNP